MLYKKSTSPFKRLLKRVGITLFVAEGLAFAGSYYFWHKLNTDRDFRLHVHNNYPVVLEYFYKFGETIGSSQARHIDQAYWEDKRN